MMFFEVFVVLLFGDGGVSGVFVSLFWSWIIGLWRSIVRPPEPDDEEGVLESMVVVAA